MELRQVRYFVAVAEELHFGRAADRLHVTQPSLSQAVRRLEDELGVVLLERTSRSVHVTDAGRLLLDEGRRLLVDADRVARDVQDVGRGGRREVRLGFLPPGLGGRTGPVLERFRTAHPRVSVRLRPLELPELATVVLDGEVDAAVVLGPVEPRHGVEAEPLALVPRVLCLRADHPLAARERITLSDLDGETLLPTSTRIVSKPVQDDWVGKPWPEGVDIRLGAPVERAEEALQRVLLGEGLLVTTAEVARELPRPELAFVEVEGLEPTVCTLVWRAAPPPLVRDLVDAVTAAYEVPGAPPRSAAA
jgi:DNA-binding transcriptional LysR family regulator